MKKYTLLLLFLGVALLHNLGNWSLPLIDRDEPRFAEASREMMQGGDYIVPHFNSKPRYDKPPLIYWLHVASYRLLGDNEFAARLPSTLLAAGCAVLLLLWGTRLRNEAYGLRAAIIFALCLQTAVHARAAVADMAMIFFVLLAAWCGWEWCGAAPATAAAGQKLAERKTTGWAAGFWLSLAFGFLAKGPIAWLPLGMLAWSVCRLPKERRPSPLAWIGGAVVMLGIVAAWGVPALLITGGDYAEIGLGKHVVARSIGSMEGHGSENLGGYFLALPLYFVTVWPSFFPWSLWLPASISRLRKEKPAAGSVQGYLLAGVVLTFVIFTLVRTKLPHYTLPAFPFLALLVAEHWETAGASLKKFRYTAIASASVLVLLTLIGFPLVASHFASEAIYKKAEPYLTPSMEIATSGYQEPSLVWAFRRKITGYQTSMKPSRLDEWMEKPGPRLALLPTGDLAKAFPTVNPAWKRVDATGWQVANGRKVDLTLLIKPE